MAEQFLHGVEVVEINDGPRTIRTTVSSVIGVIGTAPEADENFFPYHQPVLILGSRREAAKLGVLGTLPCALTGILDQIGAAVVVVRVPEEADLDDIMAHIRGGVDPLTGQYSGVHAFLGAESTVHVAPRILIAPGFTHQRLNNQANPVVTALITIAERLRAVIIADGPNTTDQEAIAARKDYGSARVYMIDPWVTTETGQTVPASPYVAGLMAKNDNDNGFWWSPSNQVINGIVGTCRPVDFSFGDPQCRANFLNSQDVATIIRQDGYRVWGNRTCASDPKWAFLPVRRTADLIQDSVLRAHLWAVDRNITRTYVDEVVESVNAYLARLKTLGAILGGCCYADPELNTPANIAQGQVTFDFTFTPPYPAEKIVFRAHLVNDYIKELF